MHLQNVVIQLRKDCSHPILFKGLREDGPRTVTRYARSTQAQVLHLLAVDSPSTVSGVGLGVRGYKRCPLYHIEGSTVLERGSKIDSSSSLPVRAGRLGIDLTTAANTVVFYDKDWVRGSQALFDCHRCADRTWRFSTSNHQMDLYTSDCVVPTIQRVSNYTIESKIPRRTSEKREPEILVIAEGNFKAPICNNAKSETWQTITEMAAQLLEHRRG
ncbi:hypothetical protein EDB83DRAFT_2626811 [Lactarius deliciosus]|nr:hypothetical protein EDB83DRAFT_2626811 [Lactarius deliciosus]